MLGKRKKKKLAKVKILKDVRERGLTWRSPFKILASLRQLFTLKWGFFFISKGICFTLWGLSGSGFLSAYSSLVCASHA